jgi:manganese/zinc/iron transport system permease protein
VVAVARRRARQRWEFAQAILTIHLLDHEGSPQAAEESRESHLHAHLRWAPDFARIVVRRAESAGLLTRTGEHLALTDQGRASARETMAGV